MAQSAVGPVGEPFAKVERIAVLRGGGLGDLMFAMPAIQALANTYPEAAITLLGTPVHAALLDGRPGPVDEVVVLPYSEGVRPRPAGVPEDDPGQVAGFSERMRLRAFDLAVQVHGGGRYSNAFLLGLGARHTVGTGTEDAAELQRSIPYHYYQHEVLRALEVVGLAGAVTAGLGARLEVGEADRKEAAGVLCGLAGALDARAPKLVIHPGASDPRRMWPAASFAAVAQRAAAAGYEVFLIGEAAEATLGQEIRSRIEGDVAGAVHVLAGKLGLGGLLGLLEAADVMLGNDSGPRHLAQAVGTPTVGIFWAGNMIMAAPFERSRHRVHLGWVTRCPECGIEVTQVGWSAPDCGHVFPLTAEVTVDAVLADVVDLRARNPRPRGR